MKFIHTILVLFCIGFLPLIAQNDSEAEAILKSVSEKYKTIESSKIDLELIIKIPESEEDVKTKGKAWLKGDMFKIEFDERMLVSNTKTQWTYLKEVNEVQISTYDPGAMIFLPSKIFNIYSDEYYFRVKEEYKNEKKELVKVLELNPYNKDFQIFKIVVAVNMSKNEVVSSEIFEKSGMRYKYRILSLETNLKLKDDFFTFDPKKYKIEEEDITDLR